MKKSVRYVKDNLITKEREDVLEDLDDFETDKGDFVRTYRVIRGQGPYRIEILESDLEKALAIAYMEGQSASEKDFQITGEEGTNTLKVIHSPSGVTSTKTGRTYLATRNEAISEIIDKYVEA